jgi:hypothetical protein
MSKMTNWFPPRIKPVRKGVYQIQYWKTQSPEYTAMYATWNGVRWSIGSYKLSDGNHNDFDGANQNKFWRGFTEEQS